MRRDVVHYRSGQAVVRGHQPLDATLVQLKPAPPVGEVWTGPEQELRARLRDQARDCRVKPFGDVEDMPGLPRGWVAMRVYFTDRELKRTQRPAPRKVWLWVVTGIAAVAAGVGFLGYWLWTTIAAAAAGVTFGGLVGAGVIAALVMAAAGGTSVITVLVKVTVRR
jgi:hypothetical protein